MTVTFFGERWDAPMVDGAEQVPTPVGRPCTACTERIEPGDRGLMRCCVRMGADGKPQGTLEPVHTECDMLGVIGHQYGVCSCTGWGHTRAAALMLLERLNARRQAHGMGPL